MDVPVHHANPFLKVTVCFCKQSGTVRFFSCAYFCKCRSICFSVLGSCVTSSGGIVHIPGVGTGNGVAVGRGVEGRGNAHHSYLFPRSSPFLSLPKKLWVNSRNCICNGLCSEILPDPFSNQGFWKPWKPPLPPRPCFWCLEGSLGSEITGKQLSEEQLEREGIFPSWKSWKRKTKHFGPSLSDSSFVVFPLHWLLDTRKDFLCKWPLSRHQVTTVKKRLNIDKKEFPDFFLSEKRSRRLVYNLLVLQMRTDPELSNSLLLKYLHSNFHDRIVIKG